MNRAPRYEDITWFLDLRRNKQLDLNPSYQRRSVWTSKDRKFFLDTIFRGFPSPAIYLHKTLDTDGNATYHVVDGKQRLETIFRFVDNRLRIDREFGDRTLAGKRWKDLHEDQDTKRLFWNYILPVEFIEDIDTILVRDVFDRLNRNSRKLERQELRHAKYDGWLISLAESESEMDEWSEWKVSTRGRARRMKDVQFISELLLVLLEGHQSGFDQDHLDDMYAKYETPIEDIHTFVEEEILAELKIVKDYMSSLEDIDNCVSTNAKTFNSFYTLWSLIVLNSDNLPSPSEFADKFINLMKRVEELADQDQLEEFLDKADKILFAEPLAYFLNSSGASTELPQRESRLVALKAVCIENNK